MRLTQRKLLLGLLAVPTILLIGMGLAFGWVTPANSYYHLGGPRFYFTRMLCWAGIGCCLATMAYLVGWRRWLKAAPIIAIGWVGLVMYASTCPLVNGHWGWISVGCFRINVLEFGPVVLSLFAAYLARVFNCKAFVVVGMALLVIVGAVGYRAYCRQNRYEQSDLLPSQQIVARDAHQTAYAFLQNQCAGAIRESKWFGSCDINLRLLPESTTTCMPASASVLFGKWYLVMLAFALGMMGVGIGVAWRTSSAEPMRAYVLIWGGLVLIPCFLNILGCVGFAPMFDFGIPFACYGGTLVMSTMIGLAILASQQGESASGQPLTCRDWAQAVVPVAAMVLVTLWGILSVSLRENFTYLGAHEPHGQEEGGAK